MAGQRLIRCSSFDEVLPYWRDQLWPGRRSAIEPISVMRFMGGYDMSIQRNPVTFFVYVVPQIVGTISVFPTGATEWRYRGVWTSPDHRKQGVATALLLATEAHARGHGGVTMWAYPRQAAIAVYENIGYHRVSDWLHDGEFGPNCYVLKNL